MFMVSEAEAATIRSAFDLGGEFSAMLELRRLFPGVAVEHARSCARIIAGWTPLPPPKSGVKRKAVKSGKSTDAAHRA